MLEDSTSTLTEKIISHPTKLSNMTQDHITISSYNCSGLSNPTKRHTVFSWLKDKNHQLYFLQETHSLPSDEDKWRKEWDGSIIFCHGSRRSKGLMILFKKQLDFTIISTHIHAHSRSIISIVKVEQKQYCLVNLYGPNNDDPTVIESICDTILELQDHFDYIIMAGDFNTALNCNIDRKGNQTSNYHQHTLTEIQKTMDTLELVDIWRIKNPQKIQFTWRRSTRASRIDYFLISFSLIPKINKVNIGDRFKSDHHLITLQLTVNEYPRGPGYWKFNQSLLTDDQYITKTKSFITDFFNINIGSSDPLTVWDAFKCTLRGHTIAYSSQKIKRLNQAEKNLANEIELLTTRANLSNDIEILNLLDDKQKEYERLLQERATNTYFAKKAEWMEKGNKCTKFFLNMQHKNYSKKNIAKLSLDNQKFISSPHEILKEEENFYSKIFSFDSESTPLESCNSLFPHNFNNKLTDEQKQSTEGIITEDELWLAIKSFKPGKSPGLDGIPVEVYITFYDQIKLPLLSCYNYAYESGNLANSQKEGLISLLLKQNPNGQYKDPEYLKNWRPLTLQCCDAKILAKCIATRIQQVLSSIIHPNQSGFLKGRYIGDNIRQLLEIIEHYERLQKTGLIFIADFEKAFDTVRHDFIYKALSFFNFGQSLINWIKIMNNNTSCKIINNGYLSQSIPLLRGVKQGCPLSPYLFIIAIEMLAIKIRTNTNIKGLEINGFEEKISMYADDSNFLLSPSESSLKALTDDLNEFSKVSGLRPNYDKCTVLKIGALKGTPFSIQCDLPIKWSDGPVNILGVNIPVNLSEITTVNFTNKLSKVEKILQPWRGKVLTAYGKVALINSLIVSQFTYIFMALPTPSEHLFKMYEQKIFKFLWNNKPDKIKRKYVYNNYEKGGMKLLNLEALNFSLKANLIPKMFQNTNWFSSRLIASAHPIFKKKLFPFLQLHPSMFEAIEDSFTGLSSFLRDALKKWLSFQFHPPDNRNDILQQIIWFNSNILVQKKTLCSKRLIETNVMFINDLIGDDGKMMSHEQFSTSFGGIFPLQDYNQLIAAIPPKWKKIINGDFTNLLVCRPYAKDLRWLKGIKTNKEIYHFYMTSKNLITIPYGLHNKWEDLFDFPIPWDQVFTLIYKITTDSYTRYFQFKLIYNYLATNKMLHIWGLQQVNLCRFCEEEIEDTPHLFWYCPVVAHFWIQVQQLFTHNNKILNLDIFKVLMGDLQEENKMINNKTILFAKIFIFKTKQIESFNINRFKGFLKHNFVLETYIAEQNRKMEQHLGDWDSITTEDMLNMLA